jgi:hypothetical protein
VVVEEGEDNRPGTAVLRLRNATENKK